MSDERYPVTPKYPGVTEDDRRTLKDAAKMSSGAQKSSRSKRCNVCGEPMFWLPYDRSLLHGHVRSEAGREEARISGLCEYCFDMLTWPPDELPEPEGGDGDGRSDR